MQRASLIVQLEIIQGKEFNCDFLVIYRDVVLAFKLWREIEDSIYNLMVAEVRWLQQNCPLSNGR